MVKKMNKQPIEVIFKLLQSISFLWQLLFSCLFFLDLFLFLDLFFPWFFVQEEMPDLVVRTGQCQIRRSDCCIFEFLCLLSHFHRVLMNIWMLFSMMLLKWTSKQRPVRISVLNIYEWSCLGRIMLKGDNITLIMEAN